MKLFDVLLAFHVALFHPTLNINVWPATIGNKIYEKEIGKCEIIINWFQFIQPTNADYQVEVYDLYDRFELFRSMKYKYALI